ncbi:MAG: 6-bladed beta-propeller [Candidatus Aminicenantes bacterium]|nr:6-bladed beta-propeller [Candidatus Aminicenantes bacterium]
MGKLLITICLSIFLSLPGNADLLSFYQTGEAELSADTSYGVGTNWKEIFADEYKEMAVAENGSAYVVNPAGHNVLKFDESGTFQKKFGEKGQEDGKLFFPSSISILDGQKLLVTDYADNRKLTRFDLDGNFKQVVRTEKAIYSMVPLVDDRVAYLCQERLHSRDRDETDRKISVFIKDIKTGEEIEATSHVVRDPSFINIEGKFRISLYAYYKGDVFIESSKGNLLVGVSNRSSIDIYSPADGSKTGSIDLKIKPRKVTPAFVKKFQDAQIAKCSKRKDWLHFKTKFLEKISAAEDFFDEYLPFYQKLLTDQQGNLLILNETSPFEEKQNKIELRAYSATGQFIGQTVLKQKKLAKLDIDMKNMRWYRKMYFGKKAIYLLFGDADTPLKITKVNL